MAPSRQTLGRVLATFLGVLAAGPVAGGEWTLGGTAFERVEADSNLRLRQDGDGALAGSVTGLNLDLTRESDRIDWTIGTGGTVRGYTGAGDTAGLNGLSDPRLEGGVLRRGKRSEFEADFLLVSRPTGFTQVDETGRTSEDARETRLDLGAQLEQWLDPRNALSFGVAADLRRFSEDTDLLAPSTTWETTGRWSQRLDPRTEAGLTVGYRQFEADGAAETRTDLLSLEADFSRRPTRRHLFTASAGIGHGWTEGAGADGEEQALTFTGGLGFEWQGAREFLVAASVAQALEPSAAGALESTSRIAFRLDRRLNRQARVGVGAAVSRRSARESLGGNGGTSLFARVGPRLDYDVARDWTLGVGADYRFREDEDGTAGSARIWLQISRGFALFQ